MKFIFTEKKVKVPDEVKEYAERKVGKLDRFFRGDSTAGTESRSRLRTTAPSIA